MKISSPATSIQPAMKKNHPLRFVPFLAAAVATVALLGLPKAGAAVLTEYTFENTSVPTNIDSDLTATTATYELKDGITEEFVHPDHTGNAANYAVQFDAFGIENDSTPAATSTWIEFTLTPKAGKTFDLGTVTWYIQAKRQGFANNPYVAGSQLYVSKEADFSTTLGSSAVVESSAPASGPEGAEGPWVQGSADFSSLNTFTDADTAYFRLVLTGGSGGHTKDLRIDDIVVNAVPEPTTAALLLGGIGLLALRSRRRGRAS